MIVYESNIEEFKRNCKSGAIAKIVLDMMKQNLGITVAPNEERSWTNSLPRVAELLDAQEVNANHILIEYNMPTSKQRIDVVILGEDKSGKPSAWIIELKQWSNVSEVAWNNFRVGNYIDTHPVMQAHDYKYKLEHILGLENRMNIEYSAYLHNMLSENSPLLNTKYDGMVNLQKLYTQLTEIKMKSLILNHVKSGVGTQALKLLKTAEWKPTKTFKEYLNNSFNQIELLGTQKNVYNTVLNFVRSKRRKDKMTFIIKGDAGSGKTIVAYKLMLFLMRDLELNIKMILPGEEVREAFKRELNDEVMTSRIGGAYVSESNDSAIIDEAHKAVSRDYGTKNYRMMYKNLKFAIILIDNDQVINKKGVDADIVKEIATENGHNVSVLEIEESFRNKGERTLLDWITTNIYGKDVRSGELSYKQEYYINDSWRYKLIKHNSEKDFVETYFSDFKSSSTRMIRMWDKPWYIGPADSNGHLPPGFKIGGYDFMWNPNPSWKNQLSSNDWKTYNKSVKSYTLKAESFLISNPKPEYVGYYKHLHGYEVDNIYVYIPKMYGFKNGKVIFRYDEIAKDIKPDFWSPNSKAKSLNGKCPEIENLKIALNRLKVALTRGTKSTHIYIEDKELREWLYSKII